MTLRLPAATYTMGVVPDGRNPHASGFQTFVVRAGEAQIVAVKLYPPAARTLRVVSANGKPVSGTKVELLQPIGTAQVDVDTFPMRFDGSQTSSHNKAITWHEGITDASGQIELQGPARTRSTLRLTGAHRPTLIADVTLDEAAPLVIEVSTGATIHGRVKPARFVEQMLAIARNHQLSRAGFRLNRILPGGQRESLPGNHIARFPLGADGSFEIAGVPGGTWQLVLGFESRTLRLQTLESLRESERRELKLDLSHLLLARVSGTVVVNGERLERGSVDFRGTVLQDGQSQRTTVFARVGALPKKSTLPNESTGCPRSHLRISLSA